MDLRVEKTYKALVDAFTELSDEMPMESVNVAQLCDRAMVRRTTFYRHFADKDEFMRFYVLSMRDEIEACALHGEVGVSVREYLVRIARELCAFCLGHGRLVENALNGSMFGTLYTMLGDVMQRTILLRLQESQARGAVYAAPVEQLAQFVSGGMIQVVLAWWLAGHQGVCDEDGLAAILDRLLPQDA